LQDGTLAAIDDGFARFMTVPHISEAVNKSLENNLQNTKANPYDTHPPLRERVSATESLSSLTAQADTRPATTLLDDLQNLELQFIENRVPNMTMGTLEYVRWDEVALKVTIPRWQKAVTNYAAVLTGVSAESIPDQIPKFPEIGSRMPDPKGILLTPDQRIHRAGWLFAAALALALIQNHWELSVQPGILKLQRGTDQWNPFGAMAELTAGKLSREDWVRQCKTFGISELLLSAVACSASPKSLQPTLFDSKATI
jgi:heat shock protein HtpX